MATRFDPERFTLAWRDAASLSEVATKLGRTEPACRNYAAKLRREGVALKKFSRLPSIDVAALNALIDGGGE